MRFTIQNQSSHTRCHEHVTHHFSCRIPTNPGARCCLVSVQKQGHHVMSSCSASFCKYSFVCLSNQKSNHDMAFGLHDVEPARASGNEHHDCVGCTQDLEAGAEKRLAAIYTQTCRRCQITPHHAHSLVGHVRRPGMLKFMSCIGWACLTCTPTHHTNPLYMLHPASVSSFNRGTPLFMHIL